MLSQSPNPVGIDVPIQRLQKKLHDTLLTKWGLQTAQYLSYDRCYRNKKDNGYIAEVIKSGNDYKEVYWDDSASVVSFFGISDSIKFNMMMEAPVHLVFFVNLKKLKPNHANRADEEIRKDVLEVIGANLFGFQFQSVELWLENVLREYTGTRRDERLKAVDMHPIHSFRINFLLRYDKNICSNPKLK